MAATTGQLGLVTPTQGTLSGTWGDTVNNGITEYTNLAIAATLTLTGDGAVTLANTTGDAAATNITSTLAGAGTVTAQHAVIRVSGALTTIKAAGQSGVTVAVADKALVAFNGTDYVRVGASAGGSDTQVQFNSSGNLAGSANMTFDGSNLQLGSQGDLRFADSDSSNYVALQAPATVATNVTFTLPSVDGAANQALVTNGSGVLSFGAAGLTRAQVTTIAMLYSI